jgi:hypothetical protein
MAHVVREKTWGVIDIVVDEGRIFFQQRWQYSWQVSPGVADWTIKEKRRFHHAIDNQVWRFWSNRIKFSTAGNAAFARRHSKVPINFDVRWVLAKPHWTVTVRKLPVGSTPTTYISNVDRANMTINLDSADLASYTPSNAAGKSHKFFAVPHEFGHTFPGVDDEYVAGAKDLADTDSIMNIGDQIRARHLQPMLDELNTMIAGCTFRFP